MFNLFKLARTILLIIALIFSILLILCPLLQPENTIKNLTGRPNLIDNYSLILRLSFPCQQVYSFGDIWCHQMRDRSLFINGNQMPVCARCFGLFVGIPIGIMLSIIVRIKVYERIHRRILTALFIGYTPLAVDSAGQIMGLWISTNLIRAITGAVAGLSFGLILGMLVDVTEKCVMERKI